MVPSHQRTGAGGQVEFLGFMIVVAAILPSHLVRDIPNKAPMRYLAMGEMK